MFVSFGPRLGRSLVQMSICQKTVIALHNALAAYQIHYFLERYYKLKNIQNNQDTH